MCANSLTTLNQAAFIFHAGPRAESVLVRYFWLAKISPDALTPTNHPSTSWISYQACAL